MSSAQISRVKSILPPPFEWCEIPEGSITLKEYRDPDDGYEDPPSLLKAYLNRFAISKYLITNAQFGKFIEAGGYQNQKYWTRSGWAVHQKGLRWIEHRPVETGKAWTEPLFWQDSNLNGADYPVVGISWYEANAFCLWLSEVSGETITLPNEFRWQRAAQGDDGRIYPWGNEWDGSRCNHNVDKQGIGKTTPVQQYEGKGESPFGVLDMAGNVNEWLVTKSSGRRLSESIQGPDDRMIRGGSWQDGWYQPRDNYSDELLPSTKFFRVDERNGGAASASMDDMGFRIVKKL